MIQCAIVDDEPLAREGILNYVHSVDFLHCVGSVSNPIELEDLMHSNPIDLIFLDIKMPLMNGMDYLKMSSNKPLVIITTAYPHYAIEGYTLDVADYLLKPISFNRFFKAVNKVRKLFNLNQAKSPDREEDESDQFFFIKCEQKYEKIHFEDILYVEAMQNYVHIHLAFQKYTTLLFLKNIEQALPPEQFIRCHKSYIVNIQKVDQLDAGSLQVAGKKIPVSRSSRKMVQQTILGNHLLHKKGDITS